MGDHDKADAYTEVHRECHNRAGGLVFLKELWPMENQCQRRGKGDNVLVLPGVELILFTAASTGLGYCPENSVDNIEIY